MFDRDTLLKDLRTSVIELTFVSTENSKAPMGRFTLRPDKLPSSYLEEEAKERQFHNENPKLISAWNIVKGGWFPFHIDQVRFIQDVTDKY